MSLWERSWELQSHRHRGHIQLGEHTWLNLTDFLAGWVLGPPGMGKSKLAQLFCQDVLTHPAQPILVLIDPGGSLYEQLEGFCARLGLGHRILLFNPRAEPVIGYSPTTRNSLPLMTQAEAITLALLKGSGQFHTEETPRLYRVGKATAAALLSSGLTLTEAPHLLDILPNSIRPQITARIALEHVRREWEGMEKLAPRDRLAQLESTYSRVRAFVDNELVRRIVAQQRKSIRCQELLEEEGVSLLCNLRPGNGLTLPSVATLGALLIQDVIAAALNRQDRRRPIVLVVDEFSLFVTPDIGYILDQGRKLNLKILLLNQHAAQVQAEDPKVFAAVMQVPVKIAFGGLTQADLDLFAPEFFGQELDLAQPKRYSIYFEPQETTRTVYSESWGEYESEVISQGRMSGQTLNPDAPFLTDPVIMEQRQQSDGLATGSGSSHNESTTEVPFYEYKKQHQVAEFWSKEDQLFKKQMKLKGLEKQRFALKIRNHEHVLFDRVPDLPDVQTLAETLTRFRQAVFQNFPFYSTIEEIEAEERERLAQLFADNTFYPDYDH